MRKKLAAGLLLAALTVGAVPALAQNPPLGRTGSPAAEKTGKAPAELNGAAEESGNSALVMQEIEVRGAVRREELKSTSATVLENKDIVDRIYVQPLDFMLLAPGTSVNPSTNNGVAPTARVRTFTGSHGGELAMYLDGIPLNDSGHTDNYIDSSLVMPIEIESLEIIKGPASVYYGTGAAAGTMAFQTFKRGEFKRMKVRYGSNNETDVSGLLGDTEGDLSQVYAFQVYHNDGWREKSEWNRGNVSGRWTYDFTDDLQVSLNLRAYSSIWDNAGALRHDLNLPATAFVDDGSGESNGGKRRRFDGRLWANYMLGDESQLTLYAYGTDLDNTRWEFGFPNDYTGPGTAIGATTTGSNEQSSTRKAFGTGLSYNFKGDLGDRETEMTVGVDFLNEHEIRDRYYLPWGSGRKRGDKFTETDYILKTLSFFSEINYRLFEPLKIRLGGRYDHYSGELDTGPNQIAESSLLAGVHHYDAGGQGVFSPKAGLLYAPFDWLELYTNYGRGYALTSMTGGRFFRFGEISKRDQVELGYRLRPADWLDLEMVYFDIRTDNDSTQQQIPGTNSFETVYAGTTKRNGLETSFDLHPLEHWNLSGHYTYQTAKYVRNISSGNLMDGLRLTGVPQHIVSLELAYAPEDGLGGLIRYRWEGDNLSRNLPERAINGTVNYNPRSSNTNLTYCDLQLNYKFNEKYKLFLDVTNVFDIDNYRPSAITSAATAANGRYTESWGNPRAFYLGLDVNWE